MYGSVIDIRQIISQPHRAGTLGRDCGGFNFVISCNKKPNISCRSSGFIPHLNLHKIKCYEVKSCRGSP